MYWSKPTIKKKKREKKKNKTPHKKINNNRKNRPKTQHWQRTKGPQKKSKTFILLDSFKENLVMVLHNSYQTWTECNHGFTRLLYRTWKSDCVVCNNYNTVLVFITICQDRRGGWGVSLIVSLDRRRWRYTHYYYMFQEQHW